MSENENRETCLVCQFVGQSGKIEYHVYSIGSLRRNAFDHSSGRIALCGFQRSYPGQSDFWVADLTWAEQSAIIDGERIPDCPRWPYS